MNPNKKVLITLLSFGLAMVIIACLWGFNPVLPLPDVTVTPFLDVTVTPDTVLTETPPTILTNSGLLYNNPIPGISLTYPVTWLYSEAGDDTNGYLITFGSSAEIVNDPGFPHAGAEMVIAINVVKTSDLPFTVNASTMGDVADYGATMLSENISPGQNLRTFTLSGYPAASGVYTATLDTDDLGTVYITAVLRNDEIILFIGLCPQTLWSEYQPTFDSIVNSANLLTP